MKKIKYVQYLFGVVLLLLSFCFPSKVVYAEPVMNFTDIPGHWAVKQISDWTNKSLVKGYPDGTFKPDNNITRAEFITLVNRAFGYMKIVPMSFSDVAETDWFITEIAKAKAIGYIGGYPEGTIKPNNPISRQEVALILAKVLKPESKQLNLAVKFTDSANIPEWSRSAICAVVASGYMGGYPDGTFQPTKAMTRAEAICVLDRAVGLLYNQAGIYGSAQGRTTVQGNVTITSGEITLRNMVIIGNLYLTEGIGEGEITLDSVEIQGITQISGGTKIKITSGTIINTMLLDTQTTILGQGKIKIAYINTSGVRIETKPTKTIMAKGVTDVSVGKIIPGSRSSSSKKTKSADRTVPTFASGYPQVANVQITQLDLLVKLNESGKAYYVILPVGAEAPTSAQVKAGKDKAGKLVADNFKGTIGVTTNQEAKVKISGLKAGRAYVLYVVAEDRAANLQSAPQKIEFKMLVPVKETVEIYSENSTVLPTSEVKVKINGSFLDSYKLYFDGHLLASTEKGTVTIASAVLYDLARVRIFYNDVFKADSDGEVTKVNSW